MRARLSAVLRPDYDALCLGRRAASLPVPFGCSLFTCQCYLSALVKLSLPVRETVASVSSGVLGCRPYIRGKGPRLLLSPSSSSFSSSPPPAPSLSSIDFSLFSFLTFNFSTVSSLCASPSTPRCSPSFSLHTVPHSHHAWHQRRVVLTLQCLEPPSTTTPLPPA